MTKEDLKALAIEWSSPDYSVWGYDRYARALATDYLRLLAQEEARGEVVAVCPSCMTADPRSDGEGGCWCYECGKEFPEPVYYQRIPKPEAAD